MNGIGKLVEFNLRQHRLSPITYQQIAAFSPKCQGSPAGQHVNGADVCSVA